MQTRWYVLIGSILILIVMAVANMAHADQLVSDDAVAHSPLWYNGASITHRIGLQSEMSTVDLGVAISIPAERGSPYNQSLNISVYSDSGYTSILLSTSTTAAIIADGAKKMVTFYFGAMPAGYWQITVYSDGGNVYGSCAAGTNDGGTHLSCTPTTDGVAYYSGIGGTPPGPSDDTTRIISITPSGEATTSPVALTMTYYATATSSVPWDTAAVSLTRLESGNTQVYSATTSANTGTITTWSASSSLSLADGYYTASWSLSSSQSYLWYVSTSTSFVVGTSTWASLLALGSTTAGAAAATSTCSIFDVGCNVIAALTWAFSPSVQSEELLSASWAQFRAVPPLGYIGAYHDVVVLAFATGTTPFVTYPTSSLEIVGSIFGTSTMQTGIEAVYWGGWAIVFYRATIALIALAI